MEEEHIEQTLCGYCGNSIGDFWDDCGLFYLTPIFDYDEGRRIPYSRKSMPACRSCYEGEPGRRHKVRYGVGDR